MSADAPDIAALSQEIVRRFSAARLKLVTVESCTGGMVAAAVTDIAGASAVLERGFVTYSNEAKIELVGVDAATLAAHGAVSQQVAREMAEGGLCHSRADVALAITGVAGPGGGSADKPVGLVHFACASKAGTVHHMARFGDVGRDKVREKSTALALRMALDAIGEANTSIA